MKKVLIFLTVGYIGLSFVGCKDASTAENDSKLQKVVIEDRWDDGKDGCYFASLNRAGTKDIGVANEWGNYPSIAYEVGFDEDTIAVKGSMCYSVSSNLDSDDVSDDITHNFKFNSDTEFRVNVTESGYDCVKADKFAEYVKDMMDTQLALTIEVKDGVAKDVSITP